MTIVVAGGTGLAGSAIVRAYQATGAEVIALNRSVVDLLDRDATTAFLKKVKPSLVVDAAAKVGGIGANNAFPVEFLSDNVRIQSNLMEAAHAADVEKFIFLGSSCIYPRDCAQPIKEEYLLTGPLEETNSAYAIAKIAGIELIKSFRKEYGRTWISLMPTNLYGPNDNFELQGSHVLPAFIRRFVEAAKQLENCPLYIDDTPALPISQLAARARRLKRTHGLDVLIIDYLQLVRPASAKDNRVNEVSEITQGMKAIAKELDIPVIALSQLSRAVESREDKRPQLSDLRESGSIEQDADVVMFVFREEYYKEREKPGDHEADKMMMWQEEMEALHGKAEIIIGKQRHGPIGTVDLSFEGQFTRFGNLVKPWQTSTRDQDF